MISRRNKEHAVPQILRMLYSVNWCRAIEKKSVVHRKISRYLHKTKAIVLATFFLVHWAKFHLSSIDIMKVSLFGYIIYFAASQLIDNISNKRILAEMVIEREGIWLDRYCSRWWRWCEFVTISDISVEQDLFLMELRDIKKFVLKRMSLHPLCMQPSAISIHQSIT